MQKTKVKNDNLVSFFDQEIETFDTNFQNKFLKVFIEDDKGFVDQIMDIVYTDYFDSYQKILLDYQIKYFEKYKFVADYDELRRVVKSKEKGMDKEHLIGVIDKLQAMNLERSKFDPVKDHCYEYFKSRSVQSALIDIAHDWKTHNYDSMKTRLEGALRVGEPKEIGHRYFKDTRKRLVKDFRCPVPTLPGLDGWMSGGLSAGELGVVLAPTGGGKSMALVRFAVEALRAGKKVIYYTLELSDSVVGQRFDASFTKIAQDDVWHYPDIIEEELFEICGPNFEHADFIIKHYSTKGETINTIISHLHHLKMVEGFEPDIVFVDYADLLKPAVHYSDKRHELTAIFESLRGMACDFEIPVWTATQTNRDAMEKEVVTLGTIGESIGKAQIADIVLGIARSTTMKGEGKATISILKSRLGADGKNLQAKFNTYIVDIEILPDEYIHVPGDHAVVNRGKKKRVNIEERDGNIQEIMRNNS